MLNLWHVVWPVSKSWEATISTLFQFFPNEIGRQ